MAQSQNRILNSLPQSIFAAVEPHLKHVNLAFATVVAETDRPVDRVLFPDTGVISLVVEMTVGDMIETAMVGRDGVVNGTSALDGKVALHRGIVQVAGAAFTIAPDILRSLADEFGPLRGILIRHEQVLLAQAQQSAGCNASHTVEARMCRWLLRIRDLTGSDEMQLTQEFLAQMLGVRRTAVSLVAGTLGSSNTAVAASVSWTSRRSKPGRANATRPSKATTNGCDAKALRDRVLLEARTVA